MGKLMMTVTQQLTEGEENELLIMTDSDGDSDSIAD